MTRRDVDVGKLASALGLGALPYRSFRNPPVRRAPPAAAPAVETAKPVIRAMAGEVPIPPPALRVISTPEREAPAAPAGLAQVIAWPAAMPASGTAAPPTRSAPEPEPLPLLLAAVADPGIPAMPPREAPSAPVEFVLLAAAIGLPSPRPDHGHAAPAPHALGASIQGDRRPPAPAAEFPLLQAALASGGRS